MRKAIFILILIFAMTATAWAGTIGPQDLLQGMTGGLLSLTNTASVDAVSHWSMKKGDFGGGAGVGLFNAFGYLNFELSLVAFQTRNTIGPDICIPFEKLTPNKSIWNQLISLDGGIFCGWNYTATIDDQYTDIKWAGFDWGLTLIKKF